MNRFSFKHSVLAILSGVVIQGGAQEYVEVPGEPVVAHELLEVMGVSFCSMRLDFEAGRDFELKVYAKRKAEKPILLLDGPVIRNDQSDVKATRRVLVTVDGLLIRPHQKMLKVGIGVFDPITGSSTVEVDNPMPKGLHYIVEKQSFIKDSKGRIVLVKGHEKSVSAAPFVSDLEYTIFLAVEPWSERKNG